MHRYLLKFSKQGDIIFTSHLDMQRAFKRAFKRAGIALAYSKGYNPHPLMSFAQPLPLGMTSVGELLEFKTSDGYPEGDIVAKLNDAVPDGISVLQCNELGDGKSISGRCYAAAYMIKLPPTAHGQREKVCRWIADYMAQDEISITKKNKRGHIENIDIKEKIRKLKVSDNLFLFTILDIGSTSNLSCEAMIGNFFDFCGIDTYREKPEITRLELYYQ